MADWRRALPLIALAWALLHVAASAAPMGRPVPPYPPNGWYLMAYEANGRSISLAASPDGQQWKTLRRNFVASCAGDPGLCKTLGGAPNRGTTNYSRFSVSTPGLAYLDPGDGTYTILL